MSHTLEPTSDPVWFEAERFLRALVRTPNAPVTFQTFADSEALKEDPAAAKRLARILHGTLEHRWRELVALSRQGAGVFVMINEGDGRGRRRENVRALRALFAEDDRGNVSASSLPLRPSIIVQSCHGLHFYWLLVPGSPVAQFKAAQKAIAKALGTDPIVNDTPRVMRLPGFPHLKNVAAPFPVTVVDVHDATYTMNDVLAAMRDPVARACGVVASTKPGVRNTTLNREAFDLGVRAARGTVSRPEAEEAIRLAAAKTELPANEIDRTIRRAFDDASAKKHERAFESFEDLTDLGNAKRFVRLARDRFLFVHQWNRWIHYDGCRWALDHARAAHELAGDVARSFFADAADALDQEVQEALTKHAKQSQKRERIEAMLSLAANAFPDLKVLPGQLDRDPWLLNVENGTLDLGTGELRPHRRQDLITKLAPVSYNPTATAPTWTRFLREILPDDDTRTFLQRAAGYSATGLITEHVLFFLFGTGRNGKSVFLAIVLGVLGDYGGTSPPDLLLAKKGEQHPTELTTLVGKRLVSAIEAGHGRGWDEARLKWLTGGDRLTARGMRQDFYEFEPTHKFWVAVNQKPRVRGTDTGIWARIREIPFLQEFRDPDDPDQSRHYLPVKDPGLKDRLLAEHPGILRWIVEGSLDWKRSGLGIPAAVRQATADYRADEDLLRPFLESYEPLSAGRVLLDDLAKAYREYADGVGEKPLSNRDMAASLRERGYLVARGAKGKAIVNQRVRVTMGDDGSQFPATRARADNSSENTLTHAHLVTQPNAADEAEEQ